MTFTEAAAEVLRLAGKPMHYKEITELAIEKNLLSHVGKSPEITMGARLAALLKKDDKANPIVRVKPGVFALRDWDSKKGRRAAKGLEEQETEAPRDEDAESEAESMDVNALEVEAVAREQHAHEHGLSHMVHASSALHAGSPRADEHGIDDEATVVSGDDQFRADLAASGAELFDDEEDDDQPILAPPSAGTGVAGGPDSNAEGGRRRRRRRRRGRGGEREFPAADGRSLPQDRASTPRLDGATAGSPNNLSSDSEGTHDSPRDVLAPSPRPMVRDRQQIMAGGSPTGIEVPVTEGEELAGRDLADAAALILGSFDRNAGPVPMRSVVDALMRRGRLGGDPAAAGLQLSASIRADNLRRTSSSQRPRFRISNGARVALTDWILGQDLTRLEQDVLSAIERYREASRRTLLRRVQELPGHAFVELALLALERAGVAQLKAVRRAGSPGGEAHFAGLHRTGADEIRTAIVIRKDGREIGRERVTDVRGALHHYGAANAGWLITTGQVLSGAREEAAAGTTSSIALFDGLAFCKLLEDYEVGVVRTRYPVSIPDLELLDLLRG